MCTFQNKNPKYFFIQTILSLSLSNFRQLYCHKSIATFFFPSNSATTLPQINCYYFFFLPFRQFYCHKFFFPFKFRPKSFFSLSFLATSLPKLLLNFSSSFRQLGCYNFFFPPIFGNLVATILIFSLLTALQFRQLGCHNWFPFRASHLALRALHLAG